MANCKAIAVSNFKGGCGKTMTAASLGIGLAKQGKRVLLLDGDSQHSLTVSFGIENPENLTATLTNMMKNIVSETEFDPTEGIIHQSEGVDILPSNSTLANMEFSLAGLFGRETILKQYIDKIKHRYDYVIEDCSPTLNLLTVNALAAADSVIIPVVPKFLDAKGLEMGKNNSTIEKLGNNHFQIIDIDNTFPGFGFFPKPGRSVSLVHGYSESEKKMEKLVTIGLMRTAITIRATNGANFSAHKLIKLLNEKLPNAFIEGGGHKNAASISFLPNKQQEVLKLFKEYVSKC